MISNGEPHLWVLVAAANVSLLARKVQTDFVRRRAEATP